MVLPNYPNLVLLFFDYFFLLSLTLSFSTFFVLLQSHFYAMKRLYLIGFMGCGKSTLGHSLATKLGYTHIDLDFYIEQRYHDSISALFEKYGEVGFRNIEQRMLHEVSELENVVISAGGGTPCYSDNLEWMLKSGYVVYLDCSMKELIVRKSVV